MSNIIVRVFLGTLAAVVLIVLTGYFVPWNNVNWGQIQLLPGKTVTVIGQSQAKQRSQVATFTAGVNATGDNKDTAVSDVNQKMEAIIKSVKDFGIKAEDIQTQNLSVHQRQETYYDEEGRQKSRPGQWEVSSSIQITLRDVDRSSSLADLLTKSGATNVYGPSFSLEDAKSAQEKLLQEAIEDARKKAEVIANSSGRALGKVISVTEGSEAGVIIPALQQAGGGAAAIEPGSQTVSKTVTVTFELK